MREAPRLPGLQGRGAYDARRPGAHMGIETATIAAAALTALLGGLVGWRAGLSRWLSDVRRDAYLGVLQAFEDAVEALTGYEAVLQTIRDELYSHLVAGNLRPGPHIPAHLEDVLIALGPAQGTVAAAEHRYERAIDQLVLVGSKQSADIGRRLRLDNAGPTVGDIRRRLEHPRQPNLYEVIQEEHSWVARNIADVPGRRRRFLAGARRDLGIPLETRARIRRWRSEMRGRVFLTVRWLWRRSPRALQRRVDWNWKERWARRIETSRRHRREAERRREEHRQWGG